MPEFKPLTLTDRDFFLKFLGNYDFSTYEYSFVTLYLWRKYCRVEFAVINDALVIKKDEEKTGSYFMQPLGYNLALLSELINVLNDIKKADTAFRFLFRDVEEPFLLQLQEIYGSSLIWQEDVKNFDYIFQTERLVSLSGEKLNKRRNQYTQFINSYSYTIEDIHDIRVQKDCLELAQSWFMVQKVKTKQLYLELDGIKDVLNDLDVLNVEGMAVYIDGKIAGFTLGERVNNKMAVIHVEKGDINYKGIYAFINKTFVEKYFKDIPYINREEDLGIAGLRKSKLAYDPLKLEKKYMVDLQ